MTQWGVIMHIRSRLARLSPPLVLLFLPKWSRYASLGDAHRVGQEGAFRPERRSPYAGNTASTCYTGGFMCHRNVFTNLPRRPRAAAATLFLLLLTPALAAATACVVPNVGGTVTLPPTGCGYISPDTLHVIINGLPPGTKILIGVEHQEFFNVISGPGGSLGGEREEFGSFLQMSMTGTGSLSGFHRTANMQAQCETHVAPRTPGDPVQSFDTDMYKIQGQLPPGDPDFDLLRSPRGQDFGMPSPGHTTLTLRPDGQFNVDSFFDITYRIDFIGHPGRPLGGCRVPPRPRFG